MMLSRRDALRCMLSTTALAGLGAAAGLGAPLNAFAGGPTLATVNVRDFGATGNGITDDTAAIHAARDAAGVGGNIILPLGTYSVSGLTASVAKQMWKLSDGAVITMKPGAAEILNITGPGVSVSGGVFQGSNGTAHDWSQQGINVRADGVTIQNVVVQNSPKLGIYVLNCNRVTISGCNIINSWDTGIFVQIGDNGPANIYDIVITNNVVDNSLSGIGTQAAGIAARGNLTYKINSVVVTGNIVKLPYDQTPATPSPCCLWNCVQYVCSNNLFVGGYIGITNPYSVNGVISNNTVHGFKRLGIELPGGLTNVTVKGNTIDPDGAGGIGSQSGIQTSNGTVKNLSITENTIKNFVNSGPVQLISFSSGTVLNRVTVARNDLASSTSDMSAIFFNGAVSNVEISANTIDGSASAHSSGIAFFKPATGVVISDNQFSNLTSSAVKVSSSVADTPGHINLLDNVYINCGAKLLNAS